MVHKMARQYNNIVEFLAPHNYKLLVSEEEYSSMEKKSIEIECPVNHVFTIGFDAFSNKKCRYKKNSIDMKTFCSTCSEQDQKKDAEDDQTRRIEERTGHKVLEINRTTRKVVYQCCKCGETNSSYITNLIGQNKGRCGHCDNEHTKLDYDDIKNRVEAMGVKLLTKKEEYINNKMLLSLICVCGNPDLKNLKDIERGRKCDKVCRQRKFKETCMEKYGVSNPSQDPEIFAKIQSSLYRRKEFVFPLTGRVVNLMGYEPQAVLYLLGQEKDKYLQKKIEEDDIMTGKLVPRFKYEDHVYFPDLYLEKNMIVEVKGDWTLHSDKEVNMKKFKAVIRGGYVLRLILMFENGGVQNDLLFEREEDVDMMIEMKFRENGRRY